MTDLLNITFSGLTVISLSTTIILLVLGATLIGLTWNIQIKPPPKAIPRRTQELTWRLFISPEAGIDAGLVTATALKAAIEAKFQISLTGSKLVLARERDRYCATLSLQAGTSSFITGKVFDVEIDLGTSAKLPARITPDDQFLGMTTLYDGITNDSAAVDLIVVPGLSSHAFGSFKSPQAAGENWLRDYLPQTIPNLRVLVYGYDSRLLHYNGKESILDFAKGLLESIYSHRQDPVTVCRPIIFLGHSLGGLLIKEALAIAMDEANRTQLDEQFFKACYGLLFFGVPNRGLRNEPLLFTVIGKKPSERLIRDLIVDHESEPSALLRTLADKFSRCTNIQDFHTVVFYETELSRTVEMKKGELTRSGTPTLMVTQDSATNIDGQNRPRNQIPLNADHSGLVKFHGIHDKNYTDSVRRHIVEMVKAAPSVIDARFSRMHRILPEQQRKLNSMRYAPLNEVRDKKIGSPCPDTLGWFLDDKDFKSWRDSPEASSFWIHGSPGQGKSVLAKFVTGHLEDHSKSQPKEKIAVINFFCYRQEGEPVDILRALILQLIDCRELYELLPDRFQESPSEFLTANLPALWEVFEILVLDSRHQRIYCIVDALDECVQAKDERADLLRRFVELFSSRKYQWLKFLVTSRPGENDIEPYLQSCEQGSKDLAPVLNISLHARTEDLTLYVQSKVDVLSQSSFSNQLKSLIRDNLCERAGTFLWTFLVIEQIAGLPAPCLDDVERLLEETPKELDELYRQLVTRLIAIPVFARILTWVAYAERALTLDELADAINYDPVIKPYTQLSEMVNYRVTISKELICGKLGTLLDVHKSDESKSHELDKVTGDSVFFIHQSVGDFFHQHGKALLSGSGFISDQGPDIYLARTCLYYLSTKEVNEQSSQTASEFAALVRKARKATKSISLHVGDIFEGECVRLSDRFQFLKYASVGWYRHIKSRQDGEHEWGKIECLLDHEQPYLLTWIRGHWESRNYMCRSVLFDNGKAFGFESFDLAIELDIHWLTELILAEQTKEDGLTEAKISEMVSQAPDSFEYLCINRKDIKMPSDVLVASIKGDNSKRGLSLLLQHRRTEICITTGVIEAAAAVYNDQDATDLVKTLLDQDDAKRLEITDECLRIAARKREGGLLEFLLSRRHQDVNIVEELFKLAAGSHGGVQAMQVLLDRFGNRIDYPEDLIITAAANDMPTIELIVNRGKGRARITEAILLASISSYQPEKALKYLLDRASKDVKITEDILNAACGNYKGPELVTVLLEERGEELVFTERVLRSALEAANGGKVLEMILDQPCATVEVTDKVLVSAINHTADRVPMALQYHWEVVDVMETILKWPLKNIQVSEAIAEIAARRLPRCQEMLSVMRMRPTGLAVSENLLKAATGNETCGLTMVQLLFQEADSHLKITEDILITAAKNTREGKEIWMWMLEEHADEINVTEQILLEAALNPFQGTDIIGLLLNQERVKVKITPAVIASAATGWLESDEMSKLLDQQEVEFQGISTTLINRGPRGMTDYLQRNLCPRMNETSLKTTKLLLNNFDPEYKTREDILLSSIGDLTERLMVQLVDEELITKRGDGTIKFDLAMMKERGITSKGLAICCSHNPIWAWILEGFCKMTQEVAAFPYQTLLLAASNAETGHLIIPEILGDADPGSLNKKLLMLMMQAAAVNGQVRVVQYVFQRFDIDESEKDKLLVLSSLRNAIKQNDEETVGHILTTIDDFDCNFDCTDAQGHTLFWQACVLNHTSIVRRLLETRAVQIERADRWKRTVLHWTAALNHSEVVKLLLQHGADFDRVDKMRLTPLEVAERWNSDAAKELLQKLRNGEKLEDIGAKDQELGLFTAFHLAARGGHAAAMRTLLDKRPDGIDARTRQLMTPLHLAARGGYDSVVKVLLEGGADVNARAVYDFTPLHFASQYDHPQVVSMLLDAGADIDARKNNKNTALHIATLNDYQAVVKALLRGGANINLPGDQECTALHLAAEHGHEEVVRMLCQNKADTSIRDYRQYTALHLAADANHEMVVKTLIEGGADINETTPDGYTVLHLAAAEGHEETVSIALEQGANGGILDDERSTALHYAAQQGHTTTVRVLLNYGVPINDLDINGWTALHCAAANGHSEAVRCLLEKGANPNIRIAFGQTALICTITRANKEIAELLIDHHADTSSVDDFGMTATAWLGRLKTNEELLSRLRGESNLEATLDTRRLKESIANMSAKALDNGSTPPRGTFYRLGHFFLILGSTEDATFAFQQGITTASDTGDLLHYGACDSCSMSPIRGTRYACRACPETDLCPSCMESYRAGKNLPQCIEHDFLEISTLEPVARDDKTVKDWLRNNVEMGLEE